MNTKTLILLGVAISTVLFLSVGVVVFTTIKEDEYDPEFATRASIFAWASRCSVQGLESWTCGKPCQMNAGVQDARAFYNSTHQIQGYTAYDQTDDTIIVAFRATTTNLNWLLDFDFFKTKYSACIGCQVHRGFLLAYKDLQQSVLSATGDLVAKYPNAKLTVVGHSLGGALAVLGALDIALNVKRVDYVYTFGQPRVGNKEFAAFFDLNIGNAYRLIHNKDPIPHLPLASQGFYHDGTEVWYNQNSTSYQVCSYDKEDKSCSNQLKSYNMDDHDLYLGRDIAASC